METRAHHILIGLFTVLVAAGAMWFVLWMANSGPGDEVDRYDVVFREAVTGLSIGSRVLHNGIHVGTVERIQIDPDDPRQVIARIQVLGTTPVKQDTRAELILANVTGASEIQLIGGTPQSPPLMGEEGAVPNIIADPSQLARLTDSLSELLKGLSTLIESGNRLLSEENTAHFTRSLENLSEFSGALAGQSEEIFRGVQSLSRVSHEAEQLLHRVNGLVDNQGEALMTNGARTMASLQSATANLDRLLRENEDGLSGGIQGLNSLGPALEELRRTMATLRNVAQRFDNNPGGYLFNRETVREFQP